MATIASLLVNLGLNTASFEAGSKRAGGALRGIARDVQAAQRSVASLGRMAIGGLIGGGIVSGMRSVVREVEAASKTTGGLAKISEAFHVDPSAIVAATKSFRELEHTIKGLLVGALAELAPVMTSIARIVRQAADAVGGFARQTFGSIGNLVRLVASAYAFIKATTIAIAVVKAITAAKLAWVSVTVMLQSVTGVGLLAALTGLAVGTAAVVALNVGFDRLTDSARGARAQLDSFNDTFQKIISPAEQYGKQLDDLARTLRAQLASGLDVIAQYQRADIPEYNVHAIEQAERTIRRIKKVLEEVTGLQQTNTALQQQGAIVDSLARRYEILTIARERGVSENIATMMVSGASPEQIEKALDLEREIAKIVKDKGNRKALEEMIALREEEVSALKNSAFAIELRAAKLLGATPAELSRILTLNAEKKSLLEVAAARIKDAQIVERMKIAGQALRVAMLSPYEALIERLKEVHKMLKAGAISAVTFGRAVHGAMGEYGRTIAAGAYHLERVAAGISVETLRGGGGQQSAMTLWQKMAANSGVSIEVQNRILAALKEPAA